MNRFAFLFASACFILLAISAQPLRKIAAHRPVIAPNTDSRRLSIEAPDYSNLYYWAAHPAKWDYSDSIPAFLNGETRDSSVDVFFLHPTTYTGNLINGGMNADIDDSALNRLTDARTILNQATVFNGSCRVFAPRYRQAHLKAYFQPRSARSKKAFDLAYEDLKKAFQYYLDHWNQGRPVIIAAHSQGSMHAVRLLQDFFDGRPLQKKLVCAYVVGWHLKKSDFKKLPFGISAEQTNCVVGWRTYKKDVEDLLIRKEKGDALCVNPVNWTTESDWSPLAMYKGGIGNHFNKLFFHDISASVAPGLNILWVDGLSNVQGEPILRRMNNLHILDYNLFWMNIRENVRDRIKSYLHNQ